MERQADVVRLYAQVDVIHQLAQRQRTGGTAIPLRGGLPQFPQVVLDHLRTHRDVAQAWADDRGRNLDNAAVTLHSSTLSVEAADRLQGGG